VKVVPALAAAELQAARTIRRRVFVDEQACPPEEEFDAFDETSRHFLALDRGRAVGAARWRWVEDGGSTTAKLERFAVLPEARGRGVGRALVAHLLADARAAGARRFLLHAQTHLLPLYGDFGFRAEGPGFVEAGIPHRRMVLEE
jgi:predicted GNAT family N-acyltransferase